MNSLQTQMFNFIPRDRTNIFFYLIGFKTNPSSQNCSFVRFCKLTSEGKSIIYFVQYPYLCLLG